MEFVKMAFERKWLFMYKQFGNERVKYNCFHLQKVIAIKPALPVKSASKEPPKEQPKPEKDKHKHKSKHKDKDKDREREKEKDKSPKKPKPTPYVPTLPNFMKPCLMFM